MDGTMLAVVEDAGTEAWLDQALQGLGRLEKVTRSDLGRVLRMLEATGASVALVEMTDRDATQSMAVINALSNARPWVTVIAVTRIADQETVLQCMRSGARDCVIVGSDGAELRDRLRRHQLVRPSHWGEELQSKVRNLTMVTAVTPQIDSAFFAQNLAVSMAAQKPGQRILAIDMDARGDTVFHSDSKNNFDLGQLLAAGRKLLHELVGVKVLVPRKDMIDQRQPLLCHPHAATLQKLDKPVAGRKRNGDLTQRSLFGHESTKNGCMSEAKCTTKPALLRQLPQQNAEKQDKKATSATAVSINKIVGRYRGLARPDDFRDRNA